MGTSRSKSLTIFGGGGERFFHLSLDKVAIELVELRQPKIKTGMVGVLGIIGISSSSSRRIA